MAAISAESVPGRIGTHSSASATAVSLMRGSTTIVRTPDASLVCWATNSCPPPDIRVSSGLLPNITWRREFFASSKELLDTQEP